jgi:hypothetical protein
VLPELGSLALMLALLLSGLLGTLPLRRRRPRPRRLDGERAAARVRAAAVRRDRLPALAASFLAQDFSVKYVATNSNSLLPPIYRFSAVWGAHEGSLLLWVLILSLWTAAVARSRAACPDDVRARVLAVIGWVGFGFLAFLLFTSNPFARLLPAALEGATSTRCCRTPGLIVHPPMLYTGYVGFSVAFAFAVAALIDGKVDARWVRWSRPWTNVAWAFLTVGIAWAAGGRTTSWAGAAGGSGIPVENASFMPWLVGAALLHSQAVTEKRGSFRGWTLLLAIAAFALSLLGTFLVRSGVLTSVHAFASDPARGVFILVLLGVVIGGSLLLYALRAPRDESGPAVRGPLARDAAAGQQPAAHRGRGDGAARHAVPAARRGARRRPHLGRPALLRPPVRAADAAARCCCCRSARSRAGSATTCRARPGCCCRGPCSPSAPRRAPWLALPGGGWKAAGACAAGLWLLLARALRACALRQGGLTPEMAGHGVRARGRGDVLLRRADDRRPEHREGRGLAPGDRSRAARLRVRVRRRRARGRSELPRRPRNDQRAPRRRHRRRAAAGESARTPAAARS